VSRDVANRGKFYEAISGLSRKCFVPLTAGGWVTSVEEVRTLLRLGADKVTINTHAVRRPDFVTECSNVFGSQCIVVSIDVRRNAQKQHEVWIDRGREVTGLSPVAWAKEVEGRGAGEIFLTSIDQEGSRMGYDLELVRSVVNAVNIPVIAFGGGFAWQHLADAILIGGAEAVAAANVFHFTEHSTKKAKDFLKTAGIDVR